MRTGEITKYNLASATEESARASAEGAVQEKAYKATFPILVNLNDKPLYIMGLKDNAGLVKEYALVDAVEFIYRSCYDNVLVLHCIDQCILLDQACIVLQAHDIEWFVIEIDKNREGSLVGLLLNGSFS